jgi:hypothetical protein
MKYKVFTSSDIDLENPNIKDIKTGKGDLFVIVNGKSFRFDVDEKGDLTLLLINGRDVKIITQNGYPAIKLI